MESFIIGMRNTVNSWNGFDISFDVISGVSDVCGKWFNSLGCRKCVSNKLHVR